MPQLLPPRRLRVNLTGIRCNPKVREALKGGRSAAENAVRYSPHDARAWLLLGSFEFSLNAPQDEVINCVKMSYYTGPSERDLVPMRLSLIARAKLFTQNDILQLVGNELRNIVTHWPDLEAAIISAYREADGKGRTSIEMLVTDLDPGLTATLKRIKGLAK
jgi:hypothetical protein